MNSQYPQWCVLKIWVFPHHIPLKKMTEWMPVNFGFKEHAFTQQSLEWWFGRLSQNRLTIWEFIENHVICAALNFNPGCLLNPWIISLALLMAARLVGLNVERAWVATINDFAASVKPKFCLVSGSCWIQFVNGHLHMSNLVWKRPGVWMADLLLLPSGISSLLVLLSPFPDDDPTAIEVWTCRPAWIPRCRTLGWNSRSPPGSAMGQSTN